MKLTENELVARLEQEIKTACSLIGECPELHTKHVMVDFGVFELAFMLKTAFESYQIHRIECQEKNCTLGDMYLRQLIALNAATMAAVKLCGIESPIAH